GLRGESQEDVSGAVHVVATLETSLPGTAVRAEPPAQGSPGRLTASRAEDEVASEQTGVQSSVAAADEVETDVGEAGGQLSHGAGREHAQVGGVVLRRAPSQEAEPALDAERVRDRAGEHALGTQHAPDLGDESIRELEVLEELTCDDGVEARVLERQRLL